MAAIPSRAGIVNASFRSVWGGVIRANLKQRNLKICTIALTLLISLKHASFEPTSSKSLGITIFSPRASRGYDGAAKQPRPARPLRRPLSAGSVRPAPPLAAGIASPCRLPARRGHFRSLNQPRIGFQPAGAVPRREALEDRHHFAG